MTKMQNEDGEKFAADAIVAELRESLVVAEVAGDDDPLPPPKIGKQVARPSRLSRRWVVLLALLAAWAMLLVLVFAAQQWRNGAGETAVYPEPAITAQPAPPLPTLPPAPAAPDLPAPVLDTSSVQPPAPVVAAPTVVIPTQPVDPTAEAPPQPTFPPDPMSDIP